MTITLDQVRAGILHPRPEAQERFAVRFPDGTTMAMLEKLRVGKNPREAAVMGILSGKDLSILLTRRTETVAEHRGQIAFPGGMRDPGDDSLLDTALRETEEEVGIPRSKLEVIGSLPPVYIWASNFVATPHIALARESLRPVPNPEEVEEVFEVPLSHLADPATIGEEERTMRGVRVIVPFYRFGERKIWGATARMLAMLMASV